MKRFAIVLSVVTGLVLFLIVTYVDGKELVANFTTAGTEKSAPADIRKSSPTSCESLIHRRLDGEDIKVPSYCLDTFINAFYKKK